MYFHFLLGSLYENISVLTASVIRIGINYENYVANHKSTTSS